MANKRARRVCRIKGWLGKLDRYFETRYFDRLPLREKLFILRRMIGNVSFQAADKVICGMWWMSEMSFLLVSFLKCAGLNWLNFWTRLQMKRFSYVRFSLRSRSVDFSIFRCKRPCFYVPPRVLTHRFALHYSSFDQLFIFFTQKNVTIRFNSF